MLRKWIIYAAFVYINLSTYPAAADDQAKCLDRDGDQSIQACTRVIDAGVLAGKDLATIYVVRATIYRSAGNYDRAIDDLTHAIEFLESKATSDVIASAYVTRGSFYSLKGDTARALDDYQHATVLDATNTQAIEATKSLRAQLAAATPKISDPPISRDIPAPNQPLPSEIPISNDIMQLVQQHSFFANAPAVRIGSYSIASTTNMRVSVGPGAIVSSNVSDVFVTWLRAGIVRTDSTDNMETTSGGRTEPGSSQTEQILAGNGCISLGSRSTSTTRLGQSFTIERTLRIDHLSGHLFPVELGNQFSYERTSQSDSTLGGKHYRDVSTFGETCSVTKKFSANIFHPDLIGTAYLVECTTHLKTAAATITSSLRTIFFDDLGYWLTVDPAVLRQQLVETGETDNGTLTQTRTKFTASTTGTRTLRSFSKVR